MTLFYRNKNKNQYLFNRKKGYYELNPNSLNYFPVVYDTEYKTNILNVYKPENLRFLVSQSVKPIHNNCDNITFSDRKRHYQIKSDCVFIDTLNIYHPNRYQLIYDKKTNTKSKLIIVIYAHFLTVDFRFPFGDKMWNQILPLIKNQTINVTKRLKINGKKIFYPRINT